MRADSGTVQWERCFWTAHAAAFPVSPLRYVDMKRSLWFMKRWMVSLGQLLSAWSADDLAGSNVVLMSSGTGTLPNPTGHGNQVSASENQSEPRPPSSPDITDTGDPLMWLPKKRKVQLDQKAKHVQTCVPCFVSLFLWKLEISIFDHKIIMYTWKAIHRWSYSAFQIVRESEIRLHSRQWRTIKVIPLGSHDPMALKLRRNAI